MSTKNKTDGKSAPTSPVLTDAIKKRTERFGDVSQVAKATTTNVYQFSCYPNFEFLFYFLGTKGETYRTIQTNYKCLIDEIHFSLFLLS